MGQYNPTHGIEKSASFNRADPFDVGVGGHTHVGGYARWFNNGGKTGIAVQVGAAKRFDSYAEVSNFPEPNDVLGVPTIFTEDGGIITTTTVESASEYMRALYI